MADNMNKKKQRKIQDGDGKDYRVDVRSAAPLSNKLKSNEANRVGRELIDPAIGEPLTNPIKRPNGRR